MASATVCADSEYEARRLSLEADRECAPLTICPPPGEYAATAATPSSDRACALVTDCSAAEYEAAPPR